MTITTTDVVWCADACRDGLWVGCESVCPTADHEKMHASTVGPCWVAGCNLWL